MQTLAETPAEAERQIRLLLDLRMDALWAKDADQFVADYTPDVVAFDLAPPLRHVGPERQDTRGWISWFDTWDGAISEEISEFTATVAPEEGIAYCHGLVRLRGTKVAEGAEVDLWFRSTWCLRRVNGAWKIAHEHHSTPFYMDGSDRAALDLTPEDGSPS
ncbi:MAG TPA: nuclear transport factor 2 family protein [Acidimicrobiales bacterium]